MSDSLREQPLELPAPAARAVTSEIWKMECDLDDVSLADVLPVVLRRRRQHPPPSALRYLLLLSALRLGPSTAERARGGSGALTGRACPCRWQ